jgi:hypothetical protein
LHQDQKKDNDQGGDGHGHKHLQEGEAYVALGNGLERAAFPDGAPDENSFHWGGNRWGGVFWARHVVQYTCYFVQVNTIGSIKNVPLDSRRDIFIFFDET